MIKSAPNSVAGETGGLPPLSIVRMLWKRKILVFAISLALCAISAAVVMKLPAIYQAEALVLVDSQKIPEKFVSSTVSTAATDRLAVISQEILSTTRLLKIIHDLGLYTEERKHKAQEEVVEQMRKDISVNIQKDNWATGKPVAFKVAYQGANPLVVAQVANQLANLYIEENLQTREVEAAGTSEFIDHQLDQAKRELDDEEQKVAKFKGEHNGSLPEQENPMLSNLSNLRVQLQGIQDTVNRAQQNKLMLETAISTEESTGAALERTLRAAADPANAAAGMSLGTAGIPQATDSAGKSIRTLENQLAEMKSRYTPDHPSVIALEDEIARLKQVQKQENAAAEAAASAAAKTGPEAGATTTSSRPPIVTREMIQQQGKLAMMRTQLAALKRDIEFQEGERTKVVQQIEAIQGRVDQLPLVEQQMAALTRDYETSKANYKSLFDKRIAAEMATDMERRQKSERFEIIDPARVPEKPSKPNRPLWLGLSAVASILIGLGLAFGLEFRKDTLLGEWEFPDGVAVLGRVPRMSLASSAHSRSVLWGRLLAVSSVMIVALAAAAYYVLKGRS